MTDLNKPVARPDETLVHLHFIKPSPTEGQVVAPASQSTWIGTSVSRQLRIGPVTGRRFLDVTIDVDGSVPEDTRPSRYLPAEYEPDPIDVADIRKALIAESYEHFGVAKRIASAAIENKGMTDDKAALVEASSAASEHAYLLAGVLRIIEDEHGPAEARKMAELFDTVREHGTEALADLNSDLDEQARDAAPTAEEVEAEETPERPEIDVTVGAPVQIWYEFPDAFTGRTSERRIPCTILKVEGDWFRVQSDRDRHSIGNYFHFRTDTFKAHHNNFGWHVEAVAR